MGVYAKYNTGIALNYRKNQVIYLVITITIIQKTKIR